MEDNEVVCAIDIETYDPHLHDWGAGSIRGDGYILGIGAYCPELGVDTYYKPEDPAIRKLLAYDVTKVFHNAVYDVDWLMNGKYHFVINGRIEDTMTRETLLDAYDFSYSLDRCCAKHNVGGKNKADTIEQWWKDNGHKTKAVEHLREIPWNIVAKYCKQDCKATYELYHAQEPEIQAQGLRTAADIECRLYPWLMHTRSNGMILDLPARRTLSDQLNDELEECTSRFYHTYGDVNINSSAQLASLFTKMGIPIRAYTEAGAPSLGAEELAEYDHPIAKEILHIRMLNKLLGTYIDGQFVDLAYNGRLYSTLYPAKRDGSGGTVTGRFSSQNPNLQNVSAREEKHGTEVRSLFIPEEGCWLGAFDYKQIEYRIFMHFAYSILNGGKYHLPAIEEIHDRFAAGESIDYHELVQRMMGWWYDEPHKRKSFRHVTKNLNFGSLYGLGYRSFAKRFKYPLMGAHPDVSEEDLPMLAKMLQDQYYARIPFVRPTMDKIQEVARERGYVKTISGRRQRLTKDGKLYKLVNYTVQGSAGDLFKKAMVDAWEAGVFNVLKSHIMVHDELVFSIPKTKEGYEACLALKECMCNAYTLNIPIGVDTEIGPDWGHCDEDNWLSFEKEVNSVSDAL